MEPPLTKKVHLEIIYSKERLTLNLQGQICTRNEKARTYRPLINAIPSDPTTFVLGKKVKKISKGAFKNYKKVKTLTLKTKKLKKKSVKGSLKSSKVVAVKVKVGNKKTNKKYVKAYKTIFTKKNAGKKVTVK